MTRRIAVTSCALSRRSFLVSAGGVGIGVAFGALPGKSLAAAMAAGAGSLKPNAWVVIGGNGIVTIMSAPAEMGQGTMTALPVVIADEMDADWHKVRVVQSPADPSKYGNPFPLMGGQMRTLASLAVAGYYDQLRLVGAQTRKVLIACAASEWGVPAAELSTEPGMVVHKQSNRKISYGALAAKAKLPDPLPQATKDDLKPSSAFRLIGKDVPRVDLPLKVNGSAKYGIDVQLPHMLYGAILYPPVEHEKPEKIDDTAAKAVKGIVKIVPIPNGVGIIGETVEATRKAKAALKVTWSATAEARKYNTAKMVEDYGGVAKDMNQKAVVMMSQGDAPAAIAGAAKMVTAEFYSEHVAHTQLEPLNATALVKGDTIEIWASNQSPSASIIFATMVGGVPPEKVVVHSTLIGGAFGRTSDDADHIAHAIMLAKAVPGRPVKLIWTREDDMRNDIFRPFSAQQVSVGLDASGDIVGWRQRIVAPSHFGRLGPPVLEHFGGKDIVTAGWGEFHYAVPAHLVEWIRAERGFDIGPWRATASGYTKFAIEVTIDELAAMKGVDPVQYRLGLLKNQPRATAVIETVAKMADWAKKRPGRALGIAYSDLYDSFLAEIAEVSLDEKTGQIKVHHIWAAVDPGLAVQPRNVAYQLEGAITMGLSAALYEQINVVNGEVQEQNFDKYRVIRMADMPMIEVKVISTDNHPSGVGEIGVGPVAPAIANAVAQLTGGKRLRHLPLSPARVQAAMKA
ncbi:MAG TPA: molybdopterin cofactor-binding domain-containing protein [Stellaceae bacterium]|nr:molybdopterin cofactor-binding domain-containing protein [Stellaceae bacterium]